MSLHLLAEHAAALASVDVADAIEDNTQGLALMRLVAADMEREAQANRADSDAVETWAGMLRWLVTTLDDRNEDLRDRCHAAGLLRQRPPA